VGAELFRADRRTGRIDRKKDMKKLRAALRNFANAPKTNQRCSYMQIMWRYKRSSVKIYAHSHAAKFGSMS